MAQIFKLVIAAILAVLLFGCGGTTSGNKDFRYKLTVKALYNGKTVEGSAIYKRRLSRSRTAYPIGEAVIIDLGNNKRVYLPMVDRMYRNYHKAIFRAALEPTFNPEGTSTDYSAYANKLMALPVGTLREYEYHGMRGQSHTPLTGFPMMVMFKNESDPASVILVDTEKPQNLFGGKFEFKSLEIEIVSKNTPVTNKILEFLPWLDEKHEYWRKQREDGYVGQSLQPIKADLSASDATFAQKLRRRYFRKLI